MIYSMRKWTEWLPFRYAENWETHFFHIHFLNMDISLVIKVTIMKIAIHVAEIDCKGRVSQNFDIGPSFYCILCRKVDFQKSYKKILKLLVFCSKIKTMT